jgi:cytochrome b561
MQLTDSRQSYGWISIAFHWLVAVLVFYLFFNGQDLEEGGERGREGFERTFGDGGEGARQFAEGFARASRDFAANIFEPRALHVSIGIILLLLILARVVWRLTQGSPPKGNDSPALNLLAFLVQWGLIAAIVVLVVTGPLINWSVGRPVQVFDWFSIPSPLTGARSLRRTIQEIHGTAANLLIPLVGLHVLGALKHVFIDRDGVMRRILVPTRT